MLSTHNYYLLTDLVDAALREYDPEYTDSELGQDPREFKAFFGDLIERYENELAI